MPSITLYQVNNGGKDDIVKQDYPCTQFIDAYDKFKDPRRNSRMQKILVHKYIESEYTVYMDANMKLLVSPIELIERYMQGYDMALFKHSRGCVYKEALEVARLGMDEPDTIIEQAKHYEDIGFPKDIGMLQGGFIIRRNNERTRRFNEAWWADYCRYSRRDQLSLMPAIDESGVIVNAIDLQWMESNGKATFGDIVEMRHHRSLEGNFNDPNKHER